MDGLNYDGMRRRETYDEIIDYIQNRQEKIQHPDRLATRLRNTPELSNLLDGAGDSLADLEQQQREQYTNIEKDLRIREMATQTNQTAQILRVDTGVSPGTQQFNIAPSDTSEGAQDIMDLYEELDKENERGRAAANAQMGNFAANMLGGIGEVVGGATMLTAKGVFHLTSGAVRGAVGAMRSADASSDTDDDVVTVDPTASSSNAKPTSSYSKSKPSKEDAKHSDLDGMSTEELKELLMEMMGDKPSGSLRNLSRQALISKIKKMRG